MFNECKKLSLACKRPLTGRFVVLKDNKCERQFVSFPIFASIFAPCNADRCVNKKKELQI